MRFSAVLVILALVIVNHSESLNNGLAQAPPMGWIHWERFKCTTDCSKYPAECINEQLFKRTVDSLVSEGYADAGYKYVIIDDCWQDRARNPFTQKLVADQDRFPNGLKCLADYIHEKGLKFGLYQNYGASTCSGYPGIIDHMELDAQTFADWNVDYVKLTGCNTDINNLQTGFTEFGRLLNKTGRPMIYSCAWPIFLQEKPNYDAWKETCNLWRNYVNINDKYDSLLSVVDYYANKQDQLQPHAGPGHWNDPDFLLLGNYGLTYEQSKTQMTVWAILAAPLIMSNDLWDVRPEIKEILQNRQIIAVNQDRLGIQGRLIFSVSDVEPLRPSGHYSHAVAFVNRQKSVPPQSIRVLVMGMGLRNPKGYMVTDLFSGVTEVDKYMPLDDFETRINPTGANFFKFTAL